jgi:hypothetical protein
LPENFPDAAVRHFEDAEILAKAQSFDGAGHLLGFAVECAIKHSVVTIRSIADVPRDHLPGLIDGAKTRLQGRNNLAIFNVLKQPNFMSGWDVAQRYESTGTITEKEFTAWKNDAYRVFGAAGLRRNKK